MVEIGDGLRCPWHPGYKPDALLRAHSLQVGLVIDYGCRRYGFRPHVQQVADDRSELDLLGPDSPAEYVISYDPRVRTHDEIDRLTRWLYCEIVERGERYLTEELTWQTQSTPTTPTGS